MALSLMFPSDLSFLPSSSSVHSGLGSEYENVDMNVDNLGFLLC